MFARVITATAQAGADGFADVLRLAEEQLPAAREQPGFLGFYLLSDAETGKMMTISLWDSREHMPTGIREAGTLDQAGFTPPVLETYEVALHA